MITDTDSIAPDGLPEFIDKTLEIQSWLNCKSKEELKTIWKCRQRSKYDAYIGNLRKTGSDS